MATTTPTPFSWPSGPQSVQVSGDWDQWTEKVDLDKQGDGSFSKQIPLPSNTKVHYKFIVDGNWTTSSTSPLVDDSGNQNNVVDVGPAPTAAEATTAKAAEIGAGVAAGVAGAATAVGAAATKFTDHVNGTTSEEAAAGASANEAEPKKEVSEAEKKADPAAALKKGADEDIRNHVPTSITSATHAAAPVLASAVATVTGADILRGNPEALPVSEQEIKKTQAEALKGDNAMLASRLEPQGGAVTDPKAATTENSKVASSVANSATMGAPVVPVTNNGFAANVTGGTGNLTTAADAGKEGGEKAGAVAAASAGAVGASAAGVSAATNGTKTPTKDAASKNATPIATAPDSKSPSTGTGVSKKEADKAAAPAAASSGPLATGKETTTSAAQEAKAAAASPEKSLPVTPTKKTPAKGDTVKEKGSRFGTVSGGRRKSNVDLSSSTQDTTAPTTDSNPATPDRKRKQSIFGKIKSALSPHSSPSK